MKIKYNNFLIITPIFFTIALVMSYLSYMNEVKEIRWGIESKAESIAIPSRIFIEHMLKEKTIDTVVEELKPKFANILKYNQAQRFYITENKHILLDTSSDKITDEVGVPTQLTTSTISEPYVKNNRQQVTIHMPISGSAANTVLSIEVDNTAFFKQIDDAFSTMIFSIILISILGLITSYILSRIVTEKIYELNKDAHAIASGNYAHNSYIGNIREFTDLGDTLNIMKSIMKEIIFKTKNIIIEEEKFRSDEDLVNTYNNTLLSTKLVSINGIDVCISSIGTLEEGCFFDCFYSANTIFAYIAKAKSGTSAIETALSANATQRYIESKVTNDELDISKLQSIFNLDYLEFISIDEHALLHNSKIIAGKIKQSEKQIKENTTHLVCQAGSLIEKELKIYLENYQELSLENISTDISKLFPSKVSELFILVKRGPTQ